jgi:hypothetical protein
MGQAPLVEAAAGVLLLLRREWVSRNGDPKVTGVRYEGLVVRHDCLPLPVSRSRFEGVGYQECPEKLESAGPVGENVCRLDGDPPPTDKNAQQRTFPAVTGKLGAGHSEVRLWRPGITRLEIVPEDAPAKVNLKLGKSTPRQGKSAGECFRNDWGCQARGDAKEGGVPGRNGWGEIDGQCCRGGTTGGGTLLDELLPLGQSPRSN